MLQRQRRMSLEHLDDPFGIIRVVRPNHQFATRTQPPAHKVDERGLNQATGVMTLLGSGIREIHKQPGHVTGPQQSIESERCVHLDDPGVLDLTRVQA
jgi:hypothetical protein